MKTIVSKQYEGFVKTPSLWCDAHVLNLKQFDIPEDIVEISNPEIVTERRLGKRVEQFFDFQIQQSTHIELIASNIQVKKGKITIGELDAILSEHENHVHVEIVYKFYLYDPNIPCENELCKWIGPNRKDTLVYKLKKLKYKQLPLLYADSCASVLNDLKLNRKLIQQKVCYKAQLYVPFGMRINNIKPLNKACIFGYYISFSKLHKLVGLEFYIPKKLDWLVQPHLAVAWLSFLDAKQKIKTCIVEKSSPMVWLKSDDGKLEKCFITYW